MVSHLYNISFIFLTSPFMVDFIFCIRVICVIRSTNHPLFSFVIMSFCLKKNHLSPFVIMSFCLKKIICLHWSLCYSVSKNYLSPSVLLLFCLKNFLCLRPSLCYSVSKTPSVFICPSVTLSPIYSVCIVLKSLDNDAY